MVKQHADERGDEVNEKALNCAVNEEQKKPWSRDDYVRDAAGIETTVIVLVRVHKAQTGDTGSPVGVPFRQIFVVARFDVVLLHLASPVSIQWAK